MVEDFRCAFCMLYVFDPVMCSECPNVFCKACQKRNYETFEICSLCRRVPKEKFKPLNKEKRKKLKQLTFQCRGCPNIMKANDNGAGVGKHEVSCSKEVKFKC